MPAYVANQPLSATDPLGLTPLGPPPINLTCLTCPDQDFWYGGFDANPGDPCAYVGDFDASCQEAPGLWPDGEPLYGGIGFGWGGGGGGGFGLGGSSRSAAGPCTAPLCYTIRPNNGGPSQGFLFQLPVLAGPVLTIIRYVWDTAISSPAPAPPTQASPSGGGGDAEVPQVRPATIGDRPYLPPSVAACSVYRASGQGIGGILYDICAGTPDGPWRDCVRGRLLGQYPGESASPVSPIQAGRYLLFDHPLDFLSCAGQPQPR